MVAGEALAQQVQSPVALFSGDNNGVLIELPAASSPMASLSGSLIFGIGTRSNNALGNATVYAVDTSGNFITTYNHQTYSQSFIDNGSNGLFFLTSAITGIPVCSDAKSFYCPSSKQNLSATTSGATGIIQRHDQFQCGECDSLFSNNLTATVFGDLAGPNSLPGFDWGCRFSADAMSSPPSKAKARRAERDRTGIIRFADSRVALGGRQLPGIVP